MQLPTRSYKLISKLFCFVQKTSKSQQLTFVANIKPEIEKPRDIYLCLFTKVYCHIYIKLDGVGPVDKRPSTN